jgi:hypothetical protein
MSVIEFDKRFEVEGVKGQTKKRLRQFTSSHGMGYGLFGGNRLEKQENQERASGITLTLWSSD